MRFQAKNIYMGMEKIIDELCDVNSKFDKLTDYIINNYIDDGRFPLCMWNHFDTIGERPRTINRLEGFHRQLTREVPEVINRFRVHTLGI